VNFDGSGSSDPDLGNTISYSWDLNGDGTFGDSTVAKPSFTYSTPGTYNAVLKVTDNQAGVGYDHGFLTTHTRNHLPQFLRSIQFPLRLHFFFILATIGLKAHRERLAGALSHGQKQWLEIGMLIAQNPKLLLVDEPVAGMTDAETRTTAELLKDIARSHTVIVVEHDMEFVRMLGVKVTVLHEGSVLAEGSIDEVSANERVVEVYLGR